MSVLESQQPLPLAAVEARLVARFSPPLHREHVLRCLAEVVASFQDVPVRIYLPVLIERAAAAQLERCIRHDADPGSPRDHVSSRGT